MIYAKIENGVVVEIDGRPNWFDNSGAQVSDQLLSEHGYLPLYRTPPTYDPITHYLIEKPMSQWSVLSDRAVVTFTVNAYASAQVKANLSQYAYTKRKTLEDAGFETGGMVVPVDVVSKTNLIGARMKADKDENFSTLWRCPDGSTVELTAAMIIAVSDAALAFTDALFRANGNIDAKISSGELSTAAEVDAFFQASLTT